MNNMGFLPVGRVTPLEKEIQNAVSYKSRKRDTIASLESTLDTKKAKLNSYKKILKNGGKLHKSEVEVMQRLQKIVNDLQQLIKKERELHHIY